MRQSKDDFISAVKPDALSADLLGGHSARENSILFQFTDRLFRARTLQAIYDAAIVAICDALKCPRASILLFDSSGVMRFVAWRGLSVAYRRATDGHSPWRQDERDAEPLYIDDVHESDLDAHLKNIVVDEGINALGFIPLENGSGLIGKFMVYYDKPRVFNEEERQLGLMIARQLAFAVERYRSELTAHRLSALVESSADAIIAKTLGGIITDWNSGARNLFGYHPSEIIGQSVMLLVPPERHDEEPVILSRVGAGERIEQYETMRQRKDGSLIDISLSISPIRDASGDVVGASTIARDISHRRRAEEQQRLILREMDHRVKNLFALASSIVRLSVRAASTPTDLCSTVEERLRALSRAHALTMTPLQSDNDRGPAGVSLQTLVSTILAPYKGIVEQKPRILITGIDLIIPTLLVTPVSLLFHELATNAAKYGSLSRQNGRIEIACFNQDDNVVVRWKEIGEPTVQHSHDEGFGSFLVKASATQLGRIDHTWEPSGVSIDVTLERGKLGA